MAGIKSIDILTNSANNDKDVYWLSEVFNENTKINKTNEMYLARRINKLFNDNNFLEATPLAYKSYMGTKKIFLKKPNIDDVKTPSFEEIVINRRTTRNFNENEKITISQLSYLLYYSYGITGKIEDNAGNIKQYLRAAPSGGGLYPCEIYMIIKNVEGIERGLYHYNVKLHALECLKEGDFTGKIRELSSYDTTLSKAQIVMFITAVFPRTLFKYGDRGYRFVLLDTGHLAQNLFLSSTALGLGLFPCGGFYDDAINDFLQVDGVTESVVYELAIGAPLESSKELTERWR